MFSIALSKQPPAAKLFHCWGAKKKVTLKTSWLRCGRNPQVTFCFSGEDSNLSSCGRVFVETTLISLFPCGSVCKIPKSLSVIENSHWAGDIKKKRKPKAVYAFLLCYIVLLSSPGPLPKVIWTVRVYCLGRISRFTSIKLAWNLEMQSEGFSNHVCQWVFTLSSGLFPALCD